MPSAGRLTQKDTHVWLRPMPLAWTNPTPPNCSDLVFLLRRVLSLSASLQIGVRRGREGCSHMSLFMGRLHCGTPGGQSPCRFLILDQNDGVRYNPSLKMGWCQAFERPLSGETSVSTQNISRFLGPRPYTPHRTGPWVCRIT